MPGTGTRRRSRSGYSTYGSDDQHDIPRTPLLELPDKGTGEGPVIDTDNRGDRTSDRNTDRTSDRNTNRTDGGGQDMSNVYDMIMAMFSQQPVYEIPQEVFDILELSTQTASTLANLYSTQREDVLGRIDVEGMRALDILGQSKVDQMREAYGMERRMTGAYSKGMGEAIDTYRASREDQLGEADSMFSQMLGAYEEGGQASLDILAQRAYGGLPGESQYLDQLQAGTAGAVQDLISRGGGRGALGGIAEIYSAQQGELRGLAGQRAQFQSDALLGLAGARQQYGAGLSSIYGQEGQTRLGIMSQSDRDIAGVQERRGQGMASIFETGAQTRIGIRSNMDQVLSNTRVSLADMYAQNYQSTTGALGSALDRGSMLIRDALGGIADKRETAYNINYYEPYIAKRNTTIDFFNRNDPSDWYTNFMNQMVGSTFDQQNQGIGGQMAGAENIANAVSQGLGNYFQKSYIDAWSPQSQSIGSPTINQPYNYTPPSPTSWSSPNYPIT